MPNGAAGRAGTLESALPFLVLSRNRLSFPPVKEAYSREAPRAEGPRAATRVAGELTPASLPRLAPPSPSSFPPPSAPARPRRGRKQLGALGFQTAVASSSAADWPSGWGLGALSARADPPPGPQGTGARGASRPPGSRGPRLPPTCPPAAHKYSLRPEGAETDFPARLQALATCPARILAKRSLDATQRLSARPVQSEGRMRGPGPAADPGAPRPGTQSCGGNLQGSSPLHPGVKEGFLEMFKLNSERWKNTWMERTEYTKTKRHLGKLAVLCVTEVLSSKGSVTRPGWREWQGPIQAGPCKPSRAGAVGF